MTDERTVRVPVNGYGVIGKRVADAVGAQDDMTLAGVADVTSDWRVAVARGKGYRLYGATADHSDAAGLDPSGVLGDLLDSSDIVVDCTPKKVAAANVQGYRERGLKFIVQGGEAHAVTGHSFSAENNYASALGRSATRVVSCNTTSVVRTLVGAMLVAIGTHPYITLSDRPVKQSSSACHVPFMRVVRF